MKFKLGTGLGKELAEVDMSSLRPAREFARKYGCKALTYGPPGTGKTPILCNTSQRPVAVFHEAGTASLGDSDCPSFEAHDAVRADEFYTWFTTSAESKNFDTLIVDSGSHLMKLYLDAEKAKGNKEGGDAHGKRVYGKAAERAGKWLERIYSMPQKHVFVICKQEIIDIGGINTKRPAFDGNVLSRDIPHLYDCILHLDLYHVPQLGKQATAIRCRNSIDTMARNRTGKLDELEAPNIAVLANKYMS